MAREVSVVRCRSRRRPSSDVTATWYPLGYNIRPKRLQSIAREAVARYGGQLPADEETLLSFKGIGAYTAGAIRSFAFGERAAILDTNVARVLFRVFVAAGDPKSHAMKRQLWAVSAALVPVRHVFDFNQALMDFGAMVCVARKPKCLVCPMAEELPRISLRSGMTTIVVTAAVIERRRPPARHATAGRHPSRRLLGVSRRQVRSGRNARGVPGTRASRRARRIGAPIGAEILGVTHAYPDRRRGTALLPMPSDGRRRSRKWARRCNGSRASSSGRCTLPPADAELVELLTGSVACSGVVRTFRSAVRQA